MSGKHGNSTSSTSGKKGGVGKEFLCKIRYQNPLPSVPFPPKLLPIPPTYVNPNAGSYSQARLHHYVEYRHNTLEEATAYQAYVDADYGMSIDPCLLGVFDEDRRMAQQQNAPQDLDEKDKFLLNLPTIRKRTTDNANGVADNATGGGTSTGAQTPVGAAGGRGTAGLHRIASATKHVFDHSRDGQLQAIEKSFAFFDKYESGSSNAAPSSDLLKDLKHPTNSKVHAVEAVPLFPDEDLWANMYSVFSFDACPEPDYIADNTTEEERKKLGSDARKFLVFRPRTRPNGLGEDEQWVECFLPDSDDAAQEINRRLESSQPWQPTEDEQKEYQLGKNREYDVPVRPAPNRQDMYMLTYGKQDSNSNSAPVARYVPIKSRVMLKRRQKSKPGQGRRRHSGDNPRDPENVTSLRLQLRDFVEEEIQERAAANSKLQEMVKEEIIRADPDKDIDGDVDIEYGGNEPPNKRRRTPSYSSSAEDDDF